MARIIKATIPVIGRSEEMKRMKYFLQTHESELVAVFGRRRVGKTFLVKNIYQHEMVFHITGIQGISKNMQLENFVEVRNSHFAKSKNFEKPTNWLQALGQLKNLLGSAKKDKRVLFFDEFPWLSGNSTEFLKAFDHFWNSWAIDQNLVVVICGSATTWMVTNIINSQGGLHNRVTQKINLQPFTLSETESLLLSKGINMPRQHIIQLYMALGGIPYYLREIEKGQTVVEAINSICFGKNAFLFREFDNLYKALFKNHHKHIAVIKALATKWKGITRHEIMKYTGMASGGGLSHVLKELEDCNFIQLQQPFGKKQRETLYRLADEYSIFYLHFIENNKNASNYWLKKFNTQEAHIWQGYAFEAICMKHIQGIKNALGISGIFTKESSFVKVKDKIGPGCQIDLLIDRADNAINICEMKFYNGVYTLTEQELKIMQQKVNVLAMQTKTKKQLFLTLITSQELYQNIYAQSIDKHLDLNALFL